MNIGVLGLGKIAQKSILPAIKKTDNINLLMLGTRNRSLGICLSKKYDCKWGSYHDVIGNPNIDAVYIALPNHLHHQWGMQVLSNNKHLLCEKPMVMCYNHAKDLNNIAKERGLVLMEAFMYRFHPQHAKVRQLIKGGAIGDVIAFEARFTYSLKDLCNIRLQKDCGGGALLDVGCYGVDSARFILGMDPIKGVCFSKLGKKSQVDELSSMQLFFEGGIQAQILCSTDLPREQSYRVLGSKGVIELNQAFIPLSSKPAILKVCTQRQEIIKIAPINQYQSELNYFADMIDGKDLDDDLCSDGVKNAYILSELCKKDKVRNFSYT